MDPTIESADRITGCLLGGAVGDALGGAVEFDSLDAIRQRHGPDGIANMVPAYGITGAITDDTQMTLFTAEGVIRAHQHRLAGGDMDRVTVMHRAYLRWYHCQTGDSGPPVSGMPSTPGWLSGIGALKSQRAPGMTCLRALCDPTGRGIGQPINNSKGCGGVMRVAPIGLAIPDPVEAFRYACEAAAITHSHSTGFLASGFMAAMICRIMAGDTVLTAATETLHILRDWPDHEETERAVAGALKLAEVGNPTAAMVELLGQGWIAEEALAIGLYCAAATDSFEEAIILAVNHGGDSDSTGSIAGNIMGAMLGPAAIPERWLAVLELRDEIESIASDLHRHFHQPGFNPTGTDRQRYPPD